MSFFEHIDELASRAKICLVVFVVGFLLSYYLLAEWVMSFLSQPLFAVLPEGQQKLYFTSLFENFMTHLKIAAVCSVFFFSPFYFYQLWAFITPGLYPKERRLVLPFIFSATFFFIAGGAFAYYILFPAAFKFFVHYGAATDVPILTIEAYYTTCLKLILLFGAAFELPVLIVLLGVLGVIDARTLRENRRTAIIGITVACAMFAPPDAISMIVMMIPLFLLYEGSIYAVDWLGRRKKP